MNLKSIRLVRYLAFKYREWRDKFSYCKGRNNIVRNHGISVSSKIQISGNNNKVLIGKGTVLKTASIRIKGNNNTFIIHDDVYLSGCELYTDDSNCKIEIGNHTFIGHHTQLACTEDGSVLSVGADCMLSAYIHVRTSDSHSIISIDTNERINHAKSVNIGNHCWIGEGAKVLKGVTLQKNVVVSTGAVVTKSFDSNQLIGGVPAKILKENITWDKDWI